MTSMSKSRVRIEGVIQITAQLLDADGRLIALEVEVENGQIYSYSHAGSSLGPQQCDMPGGSDDDLPFLTDQPQSLSMPEASALSVVVATVSAALHDQPLEALSRAGLLDGPCAGRVHVAILRALRERAGRHWSRPTWNATSVRLSNAARRVADLHEELVLVSRDAPVDLAALTALAATSHDALAKLVDYLEAIRPDIDEAASASGGARAKAWRTRLVQDLAYEWRDVISDADIEMAVSAVCQVVDLIDLARPETIATAGRYVSSGQPPSPHRKYLSTSDPSRSIFEEDLPFK